jgi:hypothetical protein
MRFKVGYDSTARVVRIPVEQDTSSSTVHMKRPEMEQPCCKRHKRTQGPESKRSQGGLRTTHCSRCWEANARARTNPEPVPVPGKGAADALGEGALPKKEPAPPCGGCWNGGLLLKDPVEGGTTELGGGGKDPGGDNDPDGGNGDPDPDPDKGGEKALEGGTNPDILGGGGIIDPMGGGGIIDAMGGGGIIDPMGGGGIMPLGGGGGGGIIDPMGGGTYPGGYIP